MLGDQCLWRHGGAVVVALYFQPEARWLEAWSLPSCCFLRQETLLCIVSSMKKTMTPPTPPPPPPPQHHHHHFLECWGPKQLNMDFLCKKNYARPFPLPPSFSLAAPSNSSNFSMTPPNTTSCSFNKQTMWCMFIYRIYLNGEDFSLTLTDSVLGRVV